MAKYSRKSSSWQNWQIIVAVFMTAAAVWVVYDTVRPRHYTPSIGDGQAITNVEPAENVKFD